MFLHLSNKQTTKKEGHEQTKKSSSKCKPAVEPLHVIFKNIMTFDYMQLPGESRINFVFAFLY